MKKIILLVLIFFNVMPNIKQGVFSITCTSFANAQGAGEGYGSEPGDLSEVHLCSSTHTTIEWDEGEFHITETCTIKNTWDKDSKTCIEDPEIMADCKRVITNTSNGSNPPPDDGDEDPNNGNEQSSGNGNNTPPPPNNNPPPPPNNTPNPCSTAAKAGGTAATSLYNNTSLTSRINEYKTNLTNWGADEHMFGIGYNSITGAYQPSYNNVIGNGNSINGAQFTFDAGYSFYGMVHTHPNSSGPSATDLSELFKSGMTTSYTIGADGSVYALSVTNASLFNTFAGNYLKTSDIGSDGYFSNSSSLNFDFEKMYKSIRDDAGQSWGDATAGALGQILADKNAGVSMYKLVSNGTFKAIGASETTDFTTGKTTFDINKCN